MAYAVNDMLGSLQILERISQIDLPGTSLQKLFGWSIANFASPTIQGAVMDHPLRNGRYDIFDVSRRVATGRVPGTAPSSQRPQKVGYVDFTIPRAAETISLLHEDMRQRRSIGGQVNQLDRNVESYVEDQERYIAQRFSNLVEFQAAALLRGSYTFDQKDDDLEHRFTGGEVTINYQIPAGNLDQLDMLGTGDIISTSWADAAANITGNILSIHKAFIALTGMGLKHIVLKSPMWNNILNNTAIKAQAGTANTPFEYIQRENPGEFTAVLRGIPWVTFHIVDYGLEIWDGSSYVFTDLIEDNHVAFLPEPDRQWVEYIRGGEDVTEGPNGPTSFQYGFYPYSYPTHHPSGTVLAAVFNGIPSLKRPKAIAYADVTS